MSLSPHAINELRATARKPLPCQAINPGVVAKLTREGLARIVQLPSPFATHKGRDIQHLEATDAGRQYLKEHP